MNTQLIPVVASVISDQTVQTVDGRALHDFLEVETRFNDWIERRLDEYGFEEGKDFFGYSNLSNQTGRGGDRRSKEYALTLDMAKELSMVERNAKGKQARQYFIECEQAALQSITLPAVTPSLPVLESSLVLACGGVPIRFLIDEAGEWMATYKDVATALGFVNKEQQYSARNILKYTVKAGDRQLRHPLYGDLVSLAGIDRMVAQFERNAACEPERAQVARSLRIWLSTVAAPLVAQPASAGFLLSQQWTPPAGQLALAYDPDYQQTATLLTLWHDTLGETPYRAAEVLQQAPEALAEALREVTRSHWYSTGMNAKRVVEGLRIVSAPDKNRGVNVWAVIA